jgi:osmoprotectant transport system permease protein
MRTLPLVFLIAINVCGVFATQQRQEIRIGSKKFTESVILGEITTGLIGTVHQPVVHLRELGGTRVLWNALIRGEIDFYPEYTGTIILEILADRENVTENDLPNILKTYKIQMSRPLGFNNTYALGMDQNLAEQLNIEKISDLKKHPHLRFGFTNEFMDRQDGWINLQKFYNLPHQNVRGLDHDLAYRGISSQSIDIIDLYSTDAEIAYYQLKVLEDDLNFFEKYYAVILYRRELDTIAPEIVTRIRLLEGKITADKMRSMNKQVKIDGISENGIAVEFITDHFNLEAERRRETFISRLIVNTMDHLILVGISLFSAILIAIPLGILAYQNQKFGQVILSVVGIIQTIPSLALLVFMIPLLGIGTQPAILALFLYSLLPIVRNTHSGLVGIPETIKESAKALGLPEFTQLLRIQLPLASRSILAGIKTSAVINVGTATLGALIGAGGYGQPILTGIRLDNIGLILEGAIPAALLALLVQQVFDLSEILLVPRGLRIKI